MAMSREREAEALMEAAFEDCHLMPPPPDPPGATYGGYSSANTSTASSAPPSWVESNEAAARQVGII